MDLAKEHGYTFTAVMPLTPEIEAQWVQTESMLGAVQAEVEACGVPAVWVVFPLEPQLSAEKLALYEDDYRIPIGPHALEARAQARIAARGDELGAPVIDLLPAFRARATEPLFLRDKLVTVDPVHPSVLGHELVAETVLARLGDLGLPTLMPPAGEAEDVVQRLGDEEGDPHDPRGP